MSIRNALSALIGSGCMFALCPSHLYAADELALNADDPFFTDLPVVLTATRLTQPLKDVPGPLTILDRQMIEASGAINIADLFRLVPGFQVAHVYGHRFSVTSKGIAGSWPRRMLVMVDGRSVYTSLLSTVDWNDLPVELDDIERIEIFRGPNAPAYGANAFTGVINIITRLPFQDNGFFVKTIAGDIDTRYGMLRYAGGRSDYKQRVSIAYNENSGFANVVDDSNVGRLSYRAEYTPNNRDVYEFHLGYSDSDNEIMTWDVGDPISVAFEPQRFYTVETHYQMAKWERKTSPVDSMYLRFYHNYTNKEDLYLVQEPAVSAVGETVPFENAFYHALSERYDLEWQQTSQLAADLRTVWGANLRLDQLQSFQWTGSHETFENFSQRLFGNLEYSPGRHSFNTGLMVEKTELASEKASARLAYNFQADERNTLRASATRGYRIMSLFEENLFYALRNNSGNIILVEFDYTALPLKPEKITAYELGHLFQKQDGSLELDTSLYYQTIDDALAGFDNNTYVHPNDLDGRAENGTNDAESTQKGIELQLRYRPTKQTLLALNHSYAKMRGYALDRIDGSGNPFYENYPADKAIAPEHTTSLLLSHSFDNGWAASLAWYYVDNTEWLDLGEPVPAYDRIDIRVAKTFDWDGNRGKIEFVMQNLGSDYYEFDTKQPNNPGDLVANTFETRGFIKFSLQL